MKAYPLGIRKQVIGAYDEGRTIQSLTAEFGISRGAVENFLKLQAETGSLAPRPHGGGAAKVLNQSQLAVLRQLREQEPQAKQELLTKKLETLTGVRVSLTTVCRELRGMGFKRKKGASPREKSSSLRPVASVSVRYRRPEPQAHQVISGRKTYPSDLTEAEWALLAPFIPAAKPGGRKEEHPKREIVNAILYVLRTGCQWRMLPHDFPPHTTVYDYFRAWRDEGIWERLNQVLRERTRVRAGRNPQPTAGIMDSQSAKTTEKGGPVDMMGERS